MRTTRRGSSTRASDQGARTSQQCAAPMRLLAVLVCIAAVEGAALRPQGPDLASGPHNAHIGFQQRDASGHAAAAANVIAAAPAASAQSIARRFDENAPSATANGSESDTASPTAASQPTAGAAVVPPAGSAWLIGVLAAALAVSETILCLVVVRRLQTDSAWSSVRADLASFARAACCCACCCGGAKVVARPSKSLAATREPRPPPPPVPPPFVAETLFVEQQHVVAIV